MLQASMISEYIALFIMAIALSLDAFSVSIGMGVLPLRKRHIFRIGIFVGLFHVFMPLIGMFMGNYIAEKFGMFASILGGILLLIIGFQIFISGWKEEEVTLVPAGWGLVLFALSVSVDSFSVGLSLGIFGVKIALAIILFGTISCIFTWLGLLIGQKTRTSFGSLSGIIGGVILIGYAVQMLMKIS